MGEGQPPPVLDTEQTGPLPPVLLRALGTKDPAHCHLDWTIRQREGSTVLILRWEKESPQKKKAKAKATKKRIGSADISAGPNNVPRLSKTKKSKETETPASRTRHLDSQPKQPTALFRATGTSGKCERELPARTTTGATTAVTAAGPVKRRKTPCRTRHDLIRWQIWRARIAEKERQRELPAARPTLAMTMKTGRDKLAKARKQRELPAVIQTYATVVTPVGPPPRPPKPETTTAAPTPSPITISKDDVMRYFRQPRAASTPRN